MAPDYNRDYLSRASGTSSPQHLIGPAGIFRCMGMRKRSTPASFRREFVLRVKAARVTSGRTTVEVADYLGVTRDTYVRWETRALLPHHLIAPFCEITHTDVYRLLTGRSFDLGEAIAFMSGRKAANA